VLLVDATPKCVLDSKYEWKRIDELGGVSEIAASAGGGNVCVLLLTGDPKCWGFNAGNGVDPNTGARTTVPTIPSGINGGVTSVSIGSSNSCILMNTGGIKCWGSMMSGQFPSTAGYVPFNGEILTPGGAYSEYMPGLGAGVQAVSQGYNFQCALMAAGGVKCWGANGYGQHGDNTIGNSSVLTISDVSGLTTGVYKVATATTHACVLKIDGSIYCWGANIYGQFGIANQLYALTPVLIPGVSPSLMRKI
jgi:alpha-tubulin suppressor-like RCC1 family protein